MARLVRVGVVFEGKDDGAGNRLFGHGEVDDGLAGHEAVWNDQPPLISSAQNGVSEADVLHNAGFQTAGGADLELVAQLEGPVKHQGHAGDQVAQGVLRGHAHDDRQHPGAGEPSGAQMLQPRYDMRVGNEGQHPNSHLEQLTQETNGRLVNGLAPLLENPVQREPQGPAGQPRHNPDEDGIDRRSRQGVGVQFLFHPGNHVGERKKRHQPNRDPRHLSEENKAHLVRLAAAHLDNLKESQADGFAHQQCQKRDGDAHDSRPQPGLCVHQRKNLVPRIIHIDNVGVSPRLSRFSAAQCGQQFFVDVAKTAVAENANHVAPAGFVFEMGDNRIGMGQIGGGFPERLEVLDELVRVEPLLRLEQLEAGDFGNDYRVGIGEGIRQFVLKYIAAGGVAARLEHGPESLSGIPLPQRAQGLADGRRMMAEIVYHRDAAGHAAHFHPPPHAFEGVEAGLDLFVGQPAMLGGGDDGQRVAHIELAHHVEMELEAGDFKFGGGGAVAEIEGVNAALFAQAEAFDRAMGHIEQRRDVRVVAVGQKLAVARDQRDEPPKGGLDGGEILEDVGVIEFQVVDDDDFGKVMDEFAPLVKERRVVFVPFDDKPRAGGEPGALAEVDGDAADEEAGVQTVVLENPRQQGSGRGFAVGPGDHNGAFAADEELPEQFGQRAVPQFVIQNRFHFRVAAGQRVADDYKVRLVRQIGFRVARHDLDLLCRQESGHGRIDIVIRAGDGEALVAHRRRGGGHGGAANAGEMD